MNKQQLKSDIHKIVTELEITIVTLKKQSEIENQKWRETQNEDNLEKHFEIQKTISEVKVVIDSLTNAYNWAKRIGE